MSKKPLIMLTLAAAAVLGGCSNPTPETPETVEVQTVLDPQITELLPLSAHQMDLTLKAPNGSVLTVNGYLELGSTEDGRDCRADLRVDQRIKGDNPSNTIIDIRRDADTTWQRLVKTDSKVPVDVTNDWFDAVDYNAVRPALIFAPLYVTDGMPITKGGGSGLCTLRLLDQTAAFDPTSGNVVYDMKRVESYMTQAFKLYTDAFLRAGGAGDADVANFSDQLVKRGTPDYTKMLADLRLTLKRDGERIVLEQIFPIDGFSLTAVFTPTEKRTVEPVTAAATFFDRLSRDEVHRKMVDELIKNGIGAWGNPAQGDTRPTPQPSQS